MQHGSLKIFLLYYGFIIIHELAHIIVALLLKVNVPEIFLLPIGVNAKYQDRMNPIKELIISLAGPLASFLLSMILKESTLIRINILIGVFNLIPIYPMDGGRIVKSVFTILLGQKWGNKLNILMTKIFVVIFMLLSICCAAYLKNYYFLVLAIYILYIAKEELKKDEYIAIFNYLQKDE